MESLILCLLNVFVIILAGLQLKAAGPYANPYRWKNAERALFLVSIWATLLCIAWGVRDVL